jgi:hypothetical protein
MIVIIKRILPIVCLFFYSTISSAVPPFTVSLQPGATTSLPINGMGSANYIVSLNPSAPALKKLSVTEGVPVGVTQVTTGSSSCSNQAKVCQRSFDLKPGEQCCLQFSYQGANMALGNNILQPVVSLSVYKVRPAAPLIISVSKVIEYWVSPNAATPGNGEINSPFQNLQQAQQAIRNNPLRGEYTIYVNLRGGVYQGPSNTLTLTPKDSGSSSARVIYRAAPGETPILSGAQQVTGWQAPTGGSNIWSASVAINTPTMPRQLYVNGIRARRARSPMYPNYYTRTPTGYHYSYSGGLDPQIPPVWQNPTAVEAVTLTQWKMMRCPIDSIQSASNVVFQTPCWNNANVYTPPVNFQLLSWFENAYEFLQPPYGQPGDWYLNPTTKVLYYIPRPGEDMSTADVELPVLEKLIDARGTESEPVAYLSFENLNFMYATWYGPNGPNGYVSDQSAFLLVGPDHQPNTIGHDPDVVRTPGNVSFKYAQNILFQNNTIEHMGGAGLDFSIGSQNNQLVNNIIRDISSSGIQMGGVRPKDHHPSLPSQRTKDNWIYNNLVEFTGVEFNDAAGIFIGVTTRSTVEHNQISHVPWSGIAIGWGWGIFDPGNGFTGLQDGVPYQWPQPWGDYDTPSAAEGNRIQYNKIDHFSEKLWDSGAIYSTGFQGTSMSNGQVISGNVAEDKRPAAGSNIFYTDGGSRYITVNGNVSLNNPVGTADFGPCFLDSSIQGYCALTGIVPYGSDMGGCIPYGDLVFARNYFLNTLQFYTVCYNPNFPNFPINLSLIDNIIVHSASEVPESILNKAGRQS